MKRFTVAVLAGLSLPSLVHAQSFDTRRMAMGGVVLGGRQGGEGANVAYRALPRPWNGLHAVSLPVGLLPVLRDPPSFDPADPDFNFFRLANLVENPPWNLPLVEPATPSGDVTLDVSQNSLSLDLGDLARVFPEGRVRAYGGLNGPAPGFSVRRAFVAVAPLLEFDNDLRVNDALSGVLREGRDLAPDQHYAVTDHGRAQAAAALHVGLALPLWRSGDSAHPSRALYAGTRLKLLRGLAYGEADNLAAYDSPDTLFASRSLDLRYTGHYRSAAPGGGGMGYGLDAGALWTVGAFELGVAANDIVTRIAWRLRETLATRDSASGNYRQQVLREDVAFTSDVPPGEIANTAFHGARWLIAADVRHTLVATTAHAGLERWIGPLALRAGGSLDDARHAQVSGGMGVKLGRIALDAAVATHHRNLLDQRAVELGVGVEVVP